MADELPKDDYEDDVKAAIAELSGGKAAESEAPAAPDETADAKPAENGADAKPAERDENRDELGRFKAKEAKAEDSKPDTEKASAEKAPDADAAAAQTAAEAAKAAPKEGAADAPPSSWSVAAKAAWDSLPADVRAAVAKRESEVSSGFAQYKEFQGLKPFAELAARSGVPLATAMDHYTRLDFALQDDPQKGLQALAQSLRWSQAQAAEFFAKAAEQFGHKFTPAALQQGGAGNPSGQGAGNGVAPELMQVLQPVLQQHLAPHLQKIDGLEKSLRERTEAEQTARQASAQAIVAEFAADTRNRYYANLEDDIAHLLTTGLIVNGVQVLVQKTGDLRRDLQAAYDQACKLHPEVSAELSKAARAKEEAERKAKEAEAAAKAKAASKSVSGNRMPGSTVKEEHKGGGAIDDIEADVRAAMRQHSA